MSLSGSAQVLGDQVGTVFRDPHADHGVALRLGVGATGTEVRHDGRTVLLDDGSELPTDVVVVGVGALPRTELAEAAGLDLAAGAVASDAALRTRTGWPVLMAPSNKTFVGEMLDVELEDRLAGTLAATIAARDGAAAFRAHQVRPTWHVVEMAAGINGSRPPARTSIWIA
ncbi:FAD-dependent oxidoreductase [Streptomyces tendae]|uniref:FAD-dependent oxidoreductase n=1 Tax=Streptomyces tendae TaxID=1932 RepID=UPI0022A8539A|nr:FAD-dependent oxidoreductase [Streptomyces tendae]